MRTDPRSTSIEPAQTGLQRHVLYYGENKQQPEITELRAGPLSMIYQAGEIRYIRLGDREIVRRIYVTLRDQDWATLLPSISNLRIHDLQDSFQLTFDAEHREGKVDFFWRGTVTGDAKGTVTFTMQGQCRASFMQSRMGFCVLHPIRELAGNKCAVEHSDGTVEDHRFPLYISPHQPFTDIRALSYQVVPDLAAVVRFEGGVFETEDQRNWTDGSYKTYSPPLSVPYPTLVTPDTRISQTIRLTLEGATALPSFQAADPGTTLTITSEDCGVLPKIGIGLASEALPHAQREHVRQLKLNHLRVELKLANRDYRSVLERAWNEAALLDLPLEIALFVSDDAKEELQSLLASLAGVKPEVCSWHIYHLPEYVSNSDSLKIAREYLSQYREGVLIGGGAASNFTDLNRSRPSAEELDLFCYAVNPQIHATDNLSLIEALEGQAWTVRSAKQFARTKHITVSPVTFNPRYKAHREENTSSDPRQKSLFGAVWTVGSLKSLAESSADSVTYFETTGPRGVQQGVPQSDRVFPLYHVLADVGDFAGAKVLRTTSTRPQRVEGLALVKDKMLRLLCANFTDATESVTIRGIRGQAQLRQLDQTNAERAMMFPEEYRATTPQWVSASSGELKLDLPPYGIAKIDIEVAP